jgi:hypothetical protein
MTFSISLLTFSVYIGSAIYTPAIPGLMEAFDVSLAKATLGLTLYVLGKNTRSYVVWGSADLTPFSSLRSWCHVPLTTSGITGSRP